MSNSPFKHDNRSNIVDLLRPPAGYRIGSAIGTTYSLDFVTLTSVMLAFLDAELEEDEKYNVPQQLFAITRLAKKLCLIVNRSSILFSGVKRSNGIFAIYDRMIHEVNFANGSFHPKVWLLRYDSKGTPENIGLPPIHKLLVGSRNITASNSWELAATLTSTSDKNVSGIGESLAQFLGHINAHLPQKNDLLNDAIKTTPALNFSLPRGINDCSLAFQWPGQTTLIEKLPTAGEKAVVLSPFLGKTFLTEMLDRFDEVTLVSKRTELDKTLDRELIQALRSNIYCVREELTSEVGTSMSLHAKAILIKSGKQNFVSLGSANASRNAWKGNNCEANISFHGNLSPNQFLSQFVFKDRRKDELNPWIERYTLEDWENQPEETEEEMVEAHISKIHGVLSGFCFELSFDREQTLSLRALDSRMYQQLQDMLSGQYSVSAVPLSLIDSGVDPDWIASPLGQAFTQPYLNFKVDESQLTEFVCFRIGHELGESKTFVLKSSKHDFADLLDRRDSQLMRSRLNAKQFTQFLASVLFDSRLVTTQGVEGMLRGKGSSKSATIASGGVFIEEVLKSCTEDSSRIEEVSRIVETFDGSDNEGNRYISEDFCKFWDEFKSAFEKSGV